MRSQLLRISNKKCTSECPRNSENAPYPRSTPHARQQQGQQQQQQQQQRGKYPLSHLVGEGAARLRGLLGTSEKVPTAKPEDLRLLDSASAILSKLGVVAPAKA